MSRNLRLMFTVTTMLGAVALAPIASAKPNGPTHYQAFFAAKYKAMPKVNWGQIAAAKKIAATPKVNWAQQAIAAKIKTSKLPVSVPSKVKLPVFLPPSKLQPQPVFIHGIPVFIPGHPPVIVGGGYPHGYPVSYGSAPGPVAYGSAPGPVSYGSAPGPVSSASAPSQSAPAPAPAATYQALGLAWNRDGAWVVEQAATLDEASANALTKCNAQYGSCELSAQSVNEQAFACLGVARGADDTHRLFASRAGSQDEMQAGVLRSMSDAGTTGSIEYAACNAGSSS